MKNFAPLDPWENKLLTETGPGTPCGKLFRSYWQPVALVEDVHAGGPPKALKVMGEDLVLFRDGQGSLGLIGRYCPHRGVDLSYARVEEFGLRCLFHGWQFKADGQCIDQPGQPPGTVYANSVRHVGYPCIEAAGCVFAYLGKGEPPPLPGYDIFSAPTEHVVATRYLYDGNYAIDLEHNLDTAHVSFLHIQFIDSERSGRFGPRPKVGVTGTDLSANTLYAIDQAPRIETQILEYGLRIVTLRRVQEGEQFIRGMEFFFPNACTAPVFEDGYTLQFHVPRDDSSHWRFDISLDREQPFDKAAWKSRAQASQNPDGRMLRNRENGFLQDRNQMPDWFAGLGSVPPEHDAYVLEATWPVSERVNEQLGSQDRPIIEARRLILDAIASMEAGAPPPPAASPGHHPIVAFSSVVPTTTTWRQAWQQKVEALR